MLFLWKFPMLSVHPHMIVKMGLFLLCCFFVLSTTYGTRMLNIHCHFPKHFVLGLCGHSGALKQIWQLWIHQTLGSISWLSNNYSLYKGDRTIVPAVNELLNEAPSGFTCTEAHFIADYLRCMRFSFLSFFFFFSICHLCHIILSCMLLTFDAFYARLKFLMACIYLIHVHEFTWRHVVMVHPIYGPPNLPPIHSSR